MASKTSRTRKANGNPQAELPAWQRGAAQVAEFATCLQNVGMGVPLVYDADPYDAVLRTNAKRCAQFGLTFLGQDHFLADSMLREAALLCDLLWQRQHAKEEAKSRRQQRKAARS